MYQIIVKELESRQHWNSAIAQEPCRISALSSADYCLRGRKEVDRGQFAFRGSKKEILRLFEAEQLCAADLKNLSDRKDYTVLFLGRPRLRVVQQCAG